ncbi:zinc finger BED domain-containing protein 5-like [Leptinotarsa decemlineata]|uniref:zinc finger BED domain-containing protein 5-like n=1 Tax=Leptinotarsa decemlineata TaxID=7539 RepID=UPI003D30B126
MNPAILWHHCGIHKEALATENMPEQFKTVLDDIMQVVNFIKSRPLNSRIFGIICEEMGSIHKQLLLHAEVCWLSRDKVVTRVFQLRDEIRMFFLKNSGHSVSKYADHFNDFGWLTMAAYLADMFSALNKLNLSLQERDTNIFQVDDRIETMLKKLDLWINRTIQKNYNHFPTAFLESSGEAILPAQVQDKMVTHLRTLRSSFRDYFPVPDKNKNWISDPFNTDVSDITGLKAAQENQLIEISCDSALKRNFNESSLSSFWVNVKTDYEKISDEALKHSLLFSTIYLCEKAFSTLVYTKNKYKNRLQVESDLRLHLSSNINPNIPDLVVKKQHQLSH